MIHPWPVLLGRVNGPWKVAPAWSMINVPKLGRIQGCLEIPAIFNLYGLARRGQIGRIKENAGQFRVNGKG